MIHCMLFVDFPEKPEVMSELFATISKLVVRNEFCQAVMDMGGIHLILSAFQDSIANKVGDSSLCYNMTRVKQNNFNKTVDFSWDVTIYLLHQNKS